MELELLNVLVGGGPVAVLAGIIFFMYRQDRRSSEGQAVQTNKELIKCRGEENDTRDELTKTLTELTVLIRTMNGRK